MTWGKRAIVGGLVAFAGCGPQAGGRGGLGGGIGGITGGGDSANEGSDESDGGDASDDADDDDGGGDGGGPIFDVGSSNPGDAPDPDVGCKKVDFLFVIDNSHSMENEQAALIEAFPGFMQTIEDSLGVGNDFHVLVTDTDAWGRCNTDNPWDGMDPSADSCTNYIKNTVFEECDRTVGAGVVHPAGQFASNMPCEFASGKRYIESGEPDLAGSFACAARVGIAGHDTERPMDGLVAAISPELNNPGGCNEGFVRDDAILVITFISDDPWNVDHGTPQTWYQAVVDAKNGDPAAAVVLGMTPAFPGCRDGDGDIEGGHWASFVAMFATHGLHGDVCSDAASYVSFFDQAVSIIDEVCSDFEPPG